MRRSVTLATTKGKGEQLVIGAPKSSKPRVIDIDPKTLAVLRAHRKTMGTIGLTLASDEALVLGTLHGEVRHPERFSVRFNNRLVQARRTLGDDGLPRIRLHDLRHTHATLLLRDVQPVKVVSERLGHASPMITLSVYAHVMPGMQREAASRFATLVFGAEA